MKETKLYPFQKEGVKLIRDFDGRALLADEVGLGKTLQSLYYAWKYLPDDPPGPIIVIVPAYLKINWKREAQKHLGLRVEMLYGQRCPSEKLPPLNPNQIYVINYEILTPPHWKKRSPPPRNSWLAFLIKQRPRLVIADEGHLLGEPLSARSRALRKLSQVTPYMIILSGTPLVNRPENLWSPLNMLYPSEFGSKFEFSSQYTHTTKRPWGWEHKGAKDLDLLHSRLLDTCMIRRRKADVLGQLPPLRHDLRSIEINPDDMDEYNDAEEDFLTWLENKSPTLAKNAAKAKELVRLTYLREMVGQMKIPAIVRSVEDYLEGTEDGKLLMGVLHYSVSGPLMEQLGSEAVLVDGTKNEKEKQDAFDRFNLDPSCRILVGNINAAGLGWSCKSTSNVDICEFPWRPGDLAQFAGRIHGIERGIPGTAGYIRYYFAENTIDGDMCQLLQQKQSWQDLAIDGRTGKPDLDIYEQVKAMMRERRKQRKEASHASNT